MPKKRFSPDTYAQGILQGDRVMLSQAITLVESALPADRELAAALISLIMPYTGQSYRIGITGAPGAGKSTFIDAFGTYLIQKKAIKLAVLAVDPSSSLTKGSILGDKTRMDRLAIDPEAFIRPSAAGGSLGGVARKTRETILLCEAAGFNTLFIETVGVGQSEVAVHGMVDFFLLIMLPMAGDELQGIKKGIMEMAHGLFVNKADPPYEEKARLAASAYGQALRLFAVPPSGIRPSTGFGSALKQTGMEQIAEWLESYREKTMASGFWELNRRQQALNWLRDTLLNALETQFYESPAVQAAWREAESLVASGALPPDKAADQLIALWKSVLQ